MPFRIAARCNRLLGLWAAERLGLTGDAAAEVAEHLRHYAAEAARELGGETGSA